MSYTCNHMKYQLMIDVKKFGKPKVAPCCHFTDSIDMDVYTETVHEYDKQLASGIQIPQCVHCWDAERIGIQSVRQSGLDWKHDNNIGIKRLDIRIHNKCNLACTMCYSGASSLWGKLEGEIPVHSLSDDKLGEIRELAKNVEHISFQGGEPFYGTEYDDFLMSLENRHNITVDIFTNVISVKEEVIRRWDSELKQLYINASVDGYGDVYDSIRWPTTWKKFEKNAKMLYSIVNIRMGFFWVIQAENASNLFEFIKWRDDNMPFCKIVITMVLGTTELNINSMTAKERKSFLYQYKLYIESRPDDYLNVHSQEYNTIKNIYENILNMRVQDSLVNKRNKTMQRILKLRKAHKE